MVANFYFPYFFVLGVTETHAHQQYPPVSDEGHFYIPVEVTSDEDVKSLNAMQTALERFGLGAPHSKIASFIYTSPHFTTALGSKLYPVLRPVEYSAIYQTWQTVDDIKNLTPSCKFRKLPNIGEAIIYLLYKADYNAMKRGGVEITLPPSSPKHLRSRPFSSIPPDVNTITSVLEFSGLSGTATTHIPHVDPPSPRPLRSVAISQPLRPAASSQPLRPATTSQPLHPATMPQPLRPATTPPPLHYTTSQPVYSYIRDCTGVIGYRISPSHSPARTSLMGAHADDYFSAHGYLPGTVRLIQKAYEEAGDMNAFVDQLSGQGVAITEARYMYLLIHGD